MPQSQTAGQILLLFPGTRSSGCLEPEKIDRVDTPFEALKVFNLYA